MKKSEILNSLFYKITKMKPTCTPYQFLQSMEESNLGIPNKELTVRDVIKYSPADIRSFIEKFTQYSGCGREIRKALKNARQKLLELGLNEKDGKFISGSYLPTMHSQKNEWMQHWITELGFSKKEAEQLYTLSKKAELVLQ